MSAMNATERDPELANWVYLRGRLAADPIDRDMPSGDVLTTFRMIVTRPANARGTVDTIECVADRPRPRRTLGRAHAGDELEVIGNLRRRFWRGPAGVTSRYSVAVESVKILSPVRRGDASRARTPASA